VSVRARVLCTDKLKMYCKDFIFNLQVKEMCSSQFLCRKSLRDRLIIFLHRKDGINCISWRLGVENISSRGDQNALILN
jgi:hypothetical protein